EIANSAVVGHAAHQLVRLVWSCRHLSAIEVDSERDISLRRELLRVFLHLVIESPPFVNHHDRRMLAAAFRKRQKSTDSFVATLIAHGFCFNRSGIKQNREGRTEQCCEGCKRFVLHQNPPKSGSYFPAAACKS